MALDFIAGCFGGAAGVVAGHPFDTVKVRLQNQEKGSSVYRGTTHCFVKMAKQESFLGLYKGMSSPLVGQAILNTIVFGVEGNVKRHVLTRDTAFNHLLSGGIAGFVQTFVCCPMELCKIRVQLQGIGESRQHYTHTQHKYKNAFDCLWKIFRSEGVRGCYRGMTMTVVREVPSFAVYFLTYDYLMKSFAGGGSVQDVGLLKVMLAGGLTGISAWLVSYPADVVKTRIQTDATNGTVRYNGNIDCIVKIYRKEGGMVFWRGLFSALLRAFPTNAATISVVFLIHRLVNHYHDTKLQTPLLAAQKISAQPTIDNIHPPPDNDPKSTAP